MKNVRHAFAALAILLMPTLAWAHGKWLVPDYQSVIDAQHGSYTFYTLMSPEVWAWLAISAAVVVLASLVHRYVPEWQVIGRFADRHKNAIDHIAQSVLGIFLVVTALFWNVVVLPAESVHSSTLILLKDIQIALGLLFVFHVLSRYASLGLMLLTAVVTIANGTEAVLENAILFSLGAYFYLMHVPPRAIGAGLKKHAIDIVRIGTGVSLITLAFTEKLLYPELGIQFLALHPWNFMQPLFPWFSDQLFVLSTGFAEAIFGLVFIFGYVTRINTVVISLFFAASVTTMLLQAQVWEVEDFVVYCAAILLFFFSHANTTLPTLAQKIFVRRRR